MISELIHKIHNYPGAIPPGVTSKVVWPTPLPPVLHSQ